jgi:hypothetical protein
MQGVVNIRPRVYGAAPRFAYAGATTSMMSRNNAAKATKRLEWLNT